MVEGLHQYLYSLAESKEIGYRETAEDVEGTPIVHDERFA
jgi:hypothetical protein